MKPTTRKENTGDGFDTQETGPLTVKLHYKKNRRAPSVKIPKAFDKLLRKYLRKP